MSKTTFFKRIALTAIAALGFGMLSVAPSQATAGEPTLSATLGNAVAGTGAANGGAPSGETATAAMVTVTGLLDSATDSYVVAVFIKSFSATAATALSDSAFRVFLYDTVTYTNTIVDTWALDGSQSPVYARGLATESSAVKTDVYQSTTLDAVGNKYLLRGAAAGFVGAKFGIQVDSATTRANGYGDYVFTVRVTPFTAGAAAGSKTAGTPKETDVTLTVARDAVGLALSGGTAIDASKSKAVLLGGDVATGDFNMSAPDSSVAVVATADGTIRASLKVTTFTSDSNPAPESVTVTITGPGLVRDSGATGVAGKSLTVIGTAGSTVFDIVSDGTAGVASIVVKTTTVTFPAKTVTFYATVPSTVVASVNKPVISVGTNSDVVRATFKDANGNIWGGAAYIYASTAADALIAGSLTTPVACTFSATTQRHSCDISGATKGTASFKVIDAAGAATTAATAVANATVTSDALSVRVSTGVASSVVLSFDKATYAPGEKAQLRVSVLDGEGLSMPGVTITNALAAGGITTSSALGATSDTTTAVTFDLSGSTSAAANVNAGHKTYVVYMPATAGAVTVSATGGAGIAAAGRVALTASATVVDTSNDAAIDAATEAIDAANAATDAANLAAEAADAATVAAEEARDAADAATAAVEALSTEVATLMASLKAQITTLANTVAKIAKKVKA